MAEDPARSTDRNEVAEELPKLLIDPASALNTDLLSQMNTLIGVLGRFWAQIEFDTDEDLAGRDVHDLAVKSGSELLMEHLVSIATAATSADEGDSLAVRA